MIGLPTEEKSDRYQILKLAFEIYKEIYRCGFFIGPQVYRPYPGTELYMESERLGLKVPEQLTDWVNVVEGNFGFMLPENLPWLSRADIRDIRFIQIYFDFALNQPLKGYKKYSFISELFKRYPFFKMYLITFPRASEPHVLVQKPLNAKKRSKIERFLCWHDICFAFSFEKDLTYESWFDVRPIQVSKGDNQNDE